MSSGFNYDGYLIFNPEGKVMQLDYINKTHELGSTCLALCNNRVGVLIAHVPLRSKLVEQQHKIFPITKKAVFTFSGITNDGMSLVRYLKAKATHEEIHMDRDIHPREVFSDYSFDASQRTVSGHERLYGMQGILMADHDGIKIVHVEPTGMLYSCLGAAVGLRCQSCNSVLKHLVSNFADASAEELIDIGLKALRNAYPDPEEQMIRASDIQIAVLEANKELEMADPSKYIE